jgi:hypothetical protein
MPLPVPRALLLVLLAFAPGLAASASPALATIVDGEARLVRDTARYMLAEGVGLQPGDIVETAPGAALVRIEFGASGGVLDLGPGTRLLLAPRLRDARRARPTTAYLLEGWAKLAPPAATGSASAPGGATAPAGFASEKVDVVVLGGGSVVHVDEARAAVFQESGQATLAETAAPRDAAPRVLKSGETWLWRDGKGAVVPRPDPDFVAALPRAFRDTLPRRSAAFEAKERVPKPLPPPTYADLEPWLTAEPALRQALLPRWQKLARDADFRRELVAHRKAHPEWERILFPPPPPKPPATTGSTGAPPPAATSPATPAGAYGKP